MTSLRVFLPALLAVLIGEAAVARDIFVDNQRGDDVRDGSSVSGPCKTIGKALRVARKGDRIIVENTGEPYRESITIQSGNHSGLSGQAFQLIGNGAMLSGLSEVHPDLWEHVKGDIFRFRPPKMRHQLLYLDGKPVTRVEATDRALPKLEPLQCCLHEGYVYFRTAARQQPRDYQLEHTALPVGITVYEARNVVIRDFIVQGFQLDGINAHDGAMGAALMGLVCRGNGRSGISVGGASRVKIVDCVIGDNGVAQVRTEGYCKAELVQCEVIDNTAPGVVRDGGEVIVVE